MRLIKIELVNYIGIYNGMGLDRICIDFRNCTHKILVIKGDNGSGKSTIYKAMTPFNDNAIEFRPGLPSMKNVLYLLDDNSILDITYSTNITKSGVRSNTRASIKRVYNGNPIELNPSMNVTTAKDIIFDLFDLDDNYVALSQLSANSKGLGGSKPQDRKRYVNNIIDSLSDYMEIQKLLVKKSSIAKSLKNNIATKLDQIGNVDILSNTINTDINQLKQLENRKDYLNKKIAELNYKMESYSNIDGEDILKKYLDSEHRISVLKSSISSINIDKISSINIREEDIILLEKEVTKAESNIEYLNKELNSLQQQKNELNEELNKDNIELSSYSNKELEIDIDNRINELEEKYNYYKSKFEQIGFSNYNNVSEEEYNTAIDAIDTINSYISKISDNYESVIINAYDIIKSNSIDTFINDNETRLLNSLNIKLSSLENDLSKYKELRKTASKLSLIPKECNCSSICPFVKDIVSASNSYSENILLKLEENIDECKSNIDKVNKEIERKNIIISCINDIRFILNYASSMRNIVYKFAEDDILDQYELEHHILNATKYSISFSDYKNYSAYISSIQSIKEDIDILKDKKNSFRDQYNRITQLRVNIDKIYNKISKIDERKSSLLAQLREAENSKLQLSDKLQSIYTEKELKIKYSQFITEYDELNTFVDKYRKDIEELKIIKDNLLSLSDECNRLTHNDIPILRDKIENNKYRLSLYNQYVSEYKQYEDMYSKIQQLRYYTGINGVQTIYMEVFMNNILQDANNLLRFLFNGRFTLRPFVINETEFRIPCIDDEGNERPDISLMSDSQLSMISMIISFVLLHRASNKYNIIKLDEVDNNLDNINRLQFSILVDNIMNVLNFHQCIIISHNNELNLSNTDMILFRMDNNENYTSFKNSGANIIYDYNMGGQM